MTPSTTKIRTLVVDDEPLALQLLCCCLDSIPQIEVVGTCSNGRDAIQAASAHEPDLMFLDIQMPGLTGLDVVTNLQSDMMPLVIFATAYDQYAVKAFEVNAVDYILKPLDPQRVAVAVNRAIERLSSGKENLQAKQQLMRAVVGMQQGGDSSWNEDEEEAAGEPGKIVIRDRDVIRLIEQEKIAWIDAAGDYMCIHVEGETHIMRSTMKKLLDQLDDKIFKRVHRSTIVNTRHIKQIFTHTKGECFLQIGDNDRIKVSRNYRDVVKEFLDQV